MGAASGLADGLPRNDANVFAVFEADSVTTGALVDGANEEGGVTKFEDAGGVKVKELLEGAENPAKPVNFGAGADDA